MPKKTDTTEKDEVLARAEAGRRAKHLGQSHTEAEALGGEALGVGATANASPNYHGTLTVNQVDTISMNRAWTKISIITDGSARVDYTLDGSTPVVGGSPAGRQIPGGGAAVVDDIVFQGGAQQPTIRLISTSAVGYSVIGEY